MNAGRSSNDYDAFARADVRRNKMNPFNALYERPAILALADDVGGLRCSTPAEDEHGFWHRPRRAMMAAFTASGFAVDDIVEPDPRPEMAEVAPDSYRHLTRTAQVLFFSLTAR